MLPINYTPQPRPPRLAQLLFELTAPKGMEEDYVEDFEEKYQTWAIPRYRKMAALWAYSQALRALVIVIKEAAFEMMERVRKLT